jgi:photosystem II stability/assembly factor-like uncharacterized protein
VSDTRPSSANERFRSFPRSQRATIIHKIVIMPILVATDREVVVIDVERGASASAKGISDRPTCLTADSLAHGRVWCGTHRSGVFRSDDGGRSWQFVGLAGRLIMAIAASPVERDVVWVGTEPSEVWRSADGGTTWEQTSRLDTLSSSSEWSFPPRPDTHHVRWIACHPLEAGRLWVAIEAGALVSTIDGGRTWRDRVAGGPWDTHELAVHRNAPDTLRVAAGDGYFESDDAGATWRSPTTGLEVGYCAAWRSIRDNRTSSWYQRRPDRTLHTWLAARMAGCIAVSRASAGSASATVGQSHPAQSRRCSAPARNLERCGPPMSAACTVRTIVETAGAVSSATRRRRSIYAAWPCCGNPDEATISSGFSSA